jgi:hypothetical protein
VRELLEELRVGAPDALGPSPIVAEKLLQLAQGLVCVWPAERSAGRPCSIAAWIWRGSVGLTK